MDACRGTWLVLASLAALCLALLSPAQTPATGEADGERFTLQKGAYHYAVIESGNNSIVELTLTVDGNASVDVLLLDRAYFNDYQAAVDGAESPVSYYPAGSALDILALTRSWKVADDQTYYLVIDNTGVPDQGARANVTVTGQFTLETTPPLQAPRDQPFGRNGTEAGLPSRLGLIIMVAVVGLAAGVLIAGFKPRRRPADAAKPKGQGDKGMNRGR